MIEQPPIHKAGPVVVGQPQLCVRCGYEIDSEVDASTAWPEGGHVQVEVFGTGSRRLQLRGVDVEPTCQLRA